MRKYLVLILLIIFSGIAVAQQGFYMEMDHIVELERNGEGSHIIHGTEFREDNSNYQDNRCTLHILDKDATDTTSENGYIQYSSGTILPYDGTIPGGESTEFEDGNIPGGFFGGERTAEDAYTSLRETGFHGVVSEVGEDYVHTESNLIGEGFELSGDLLCGTGSESGDNREWRMCTSDNVDSTFYSQGQKFECENRSWEETETDNDDSDRTVDFCDRVPDPENYNRCTTQGGNDNDEASGPSDCGPNEYYSNGFNRCLKGQISEEDQDSEHEGFCSQVENPSLYRRCSQTSYNPDLENSGSNTGESATGIEEEFTRAEWAAIGSVDPSFITEENVTNLNEKTLDFGTSVDAVRDAAAANGWIAESNERWNNLIDQSDRALESGASGPSGTGQDMQAADGNLIVTAGTASPYESDSCYSEREFEPVKYGVLDEDFGPAHFEGSSWDPGEFECPGWMNGGFYNGESYDIDWEKLESIRPDPDNEENQAENGDSVDDAAADVVESENSDSVSWTSYCGTTFESNQIDGEDGINTQEATICMESCYGAEEDKKAPNSDINCGELVEDFCTPYYEYNSETNRCEEN